MKKIKKITPDCMDIGNEYALASRADSQPIGRVKVLDIIDSTTLVARMVGSGRFFTENLSEYYIFDTYKEAFIAHIYFTDDYIRDILQKSSMPKPGQMWARFDMLHGKYLEFVRLNRQPR